MQLKVGQNSKKFREEKRIMKNTLWRSKFLTIVAASALGVLIGAAIVAAVFREHIFASKYADIERYYQSQNRKNFEWADYKKILDQQQTAFIEASKNTTPCVVHIKTKSATTRNSIHDFFNPFFGIPNQPHYQSGSGSGVIISENGYIITNNHVVGDATEIKVILNDKREFDGEIVGTDPNTDIAVIKIDARNLPYIKYGDSDKLQVGEWVLAVGNPFNLTSTVTAGIVSAKARNINIIDRDDKSRFPIEAFIQTDAAVNPGNSGGALVNLNSELVGINTAIATNTGAYQGYSFAVPINLARKVAEDIINYGAVQRALLGVNIQDVDGKLAKEKGLSVSQGVYVISLAENGAAKSAGVMEGDVIVSIDNVKVNSTAELQEQVGRRRPGDKVKLKIIRGEKEMTIDVVLRNKDGNTSLIKEEKLDVNSIRSKLGASFRPISDNLKARFDIENGLEVYNVENQGKLAQEGISNGFIIISVDERPVRTVEDLVDAFNRKKTGAVLLTLITPFGKKIYRAIPAN
ncbi:MAG: Do family serine endopeptidase [Bacteroidia bacterium]|nr:Do family serine endopeptidase [Bacteroidia bacterium]MDW8301647.1 Do family serine endopeptidase [Bacteroidia bacterium]